jgi:hypothetical protein
MSKFAGLSKLNIAKSIPAATNTDDNKNDYQPAHTEINAEPELLSATAVSIPDSIAIEIPDNLNKLDANLLHNLNELQAKLEMTNQDFATNLIFIHRAIAKDPSIPTVLTVEQRRSVFQGYRIRAGIEFVASASKKRVSTVKKDAAGNVDMSAFM